jgi:hypothetical protein
MRRHEYLKSHVRVGLAERPRGDGVLLGGGEVGVSVASSANAQKIVKSRTLHKLADDLSESF